MPPRLSLSPAFERRLARTPLRRRVLSPITSSSSSSSASHVQAVSAAGPGAGLIPSVGSSRHIFGGIFGGNKKKEKEEQKRPQEEETEFEEDEDEDERDPSPFPPYRPPKQYIPRHRLEERLPKQPPDSALAVLLSRLTLSPHPSLYPAALACLTHPSYPPTPYVPSSSSSSNSVQSGASGASTSKPAAETIIPHDLNNELLASTGNSLLGMFAAEHLAHKFPLLPTETLQSAVTAYVGPTACVSVARELGIGVKPGADAGELGMGQPSASAGVPIRWERMSLEQEQAMVRPDERFERHMGEINQRSGFSEGGERAVDGSETGVSTGSEGGAGSEEMEGGEVPLDLSQIRSTKYANTFEEVVASTVRALIGLIFEQKGIHHTRQFVNAHFFSRHLDLSSLFNFKNPKYVLSSVVARHLAEAGIHKASGQARIEARLLASTGVHTNAPIFNVGLFLPSGLKLAEGAGSSKQIAEHRAAVNALLSLFLVRGDVQRAHSSSSTRSTLLGGALPSSVHATYPIGAKGLGFEVLEKAFRGKGFGGIESNVENRRRARVRPQ